MPTFDDLGAPSSTYFKAADVPPQGLHAVIEGWDVMPAARPGERNKPCLILQGHAKQLPLNATNRAELEKALGRELQNWLGRTIYIGTRQVRDPQGRSVPGVAVTVPPVAQSIAAATPVQPVPLPAATPATPVQPVSQPAAPPHTAWTLPPQEPPATIPEAPQTLAHQLGDEIPALKQ